MDSIINCLDSSLLSIAKVGVQDTIKLVSL